MSKNQTHRAFIENHIELKNNILRANSLLESICNKSETDVEIIFLNNIFKTVEELIKLDLEIILISDELLNNVLNHCRTFCEDLRNLEYTTPLNFKAVYSSGNRYLNKAKVISDLYSDIAKNNTLITDYQDAFEKLVKNTFDNQEHYFDRKFEEVERKINAISETYIAGIALKVLEETKQDLEISKKIVDPAAENRERKIQSYKRTSWAWLALSALTIVSTLYTLNAFYSSQSITLFGYAIYSPVSIPDGGDTKAYIAIIKEVMYKIFSLTLFTSVMLFSLKQYNLNKNMQLHAEHKNQALESFKEFMGATHTEQEARKTVLNKTLGAVYHLPDFGYLQHDKALDKTDIFEILKIIKSDNK